MSFLSLPPYHSGGAAGAIMPTACDRPALAFRGGVSPEQEERSRDSA
jgi:hypothetical protein